MGSCLRATAAITAFACFCTSAAYAQAQGASYTYAYDALGRLTNRADANGHSAAYTYDAAGNRTQVTFSNNVLLPNQVLASGQSIYSSGGQYRLSMQAGDGNLVVYSTTSGALWSSNTAGNPGAYATMLPSGILAVYSKSGSLLWKTNNYEGAGGYLRMQNDGNLVLYDPSGKARWMRGASVTSPDRMQVNEQMIPGEQLVSADGRFRLMYQDNGFLVINFNGQILWQSPANNPSPSNVVMQGDGNFVIYGAGGGVWSTNTAGTSGLYMIIQNDGNLVLYSSGGVGLWDSNTAGH